MSDRSAKQGRSFLESADARIRLDLDLASGFFLHLINQRSHTINAGVTGTDHTNRLSLVRISESLLGTSLLTFHTCIYTFRSLTKQVGDKTEIIFISYDDIRTLDSGQNRRRYIGLATGADSGDYNLAFIHSNLFYNTMFSINIIQIYRLYFFLLAFRLIYFIASHTPDKETNVPPNMVPHITIFHKTG